MRVQIADYRRPCSAILLPNPNAPTGIGLPRDAIAALVAEHPDQLVVIDEAYVDFGAESAVPLVARHDNLLVVQTLSKSRALAGLRVGFAIGQRPLIEALERVKDSFNSYPARLPRHRRCGRGHQGRCMVSGNARTHHREPRIAGPRPLRAGFRGSALHGELRVRAPSQPPRRRSCRPASRARRSGAAFPETADRGLPAHHRRNGRSMQPLDCPAAGFGLISSRGDCPRLFLRAEPPFPAPRRAA